jgi:hypothetical protein
MRDPLSILGLKTLLGALLLVCAAPASAQETPDIEAPQVPQILPLELDTDTLADPTADEELEAVLEAIETADAEVSADLEEAEQLEAQQERRQLRRRRNMQRAKKRRDNTSKFLGLVALLLLWLLTRKQQERQGLYAPPERHHPVSIEELGRVIYSVVRASDLNAFRALYLNGSEASEVMGTERATLYLAQRTRAYFSESLAVIKNQMPIGAIYVGLKMDDDMNCTLIINDPKGQPFEASVGEVVMVGAVLRMV